MVNQSIIYDEWLIKDFLRVFMIHAESGVTMKKSDGDVAALPPPPPPAWKVDRLQPGGSPAARLPPLHLSSAVIFFLFSFFLVI